MEAGADSVVALRLAKNLATSFVWDRVEPYLVKSLDGDFCGLQHCCKWYFRCASWSGRRLTNSGNLALSVEFVDGKLRRSVFLWRLQSYFHLKDYFFGNCERRR